jgi:hypothetical protein
VARAILDFRFWIGSAYCRLRTAYCLLFFPSPWPPLRTPNSLVPAPNFLPIGLFSHWLIWLFTIGWKWPNLVC